jgi:hypothetical protein
MRHEVTLIRLFKFLFIVFFLLAWNGKAFAAEVTAEVTRIVVSRGTVEFSGKEPTLFNEEERVQLVLTLWKPPNAQGVVLISSDLIGLKGLTKFELQEYKRNEIAIELIGVVPQALIRQGQQIKVGEFGFNLVTLVWENQADRKTILHVDAISTNEILSQSRIALIQTNQIIASSSSPTKEKAQELQKLAEKAWGSGNPELSLELCTLAKEVLQIKITPVSPGWAYFVSITLLALLAGFGWLMVIRKTGEKRADFDLKPRRW